MTALPSSIHHPLANVLSRPERRQEEAAELGRWPLLSCLGRLLQVE